MLRTVATIAGLPALFALFTFIAFGDTLLFFIFGEFYVDAWVVLVVLSVGKLVNVWTGSCGVTLMMTGTPS